MNRWTCFSTHGIVPRGLEDAGEKKNNEPAKAAAIPCRCKRGGACARVLYRRAGMASGACPVRPQSPSPLDDSTLQRPHSACCHRLRRVDGMGGWHRRIGCQVAVASGRRHSNLNNRLTIETKGKGGSHRAENGHTHTRVDASETGGLHRRRRLGKASVYV